MTTNEYASHEAFLATKIGDVCDRCGHQFKCPARPYGASRSGYNIHICVACSYEERVAGPLREERQRKSRQEVQAIREKRNK